MNQYETIKAADPINPAHQVLLKADEALCVEEVARAILGGNKPSKIDIKTATKQLKQLADLGMIEVEPRAGGVPFYRLSLAPVAESSGAVIPPPPEYDPASVAFSGVPTKTYPPSVLHAMVADLAGDSEGGEAGAPAADADKWIPFETTADSVCPVPAGTRVRYWLEDGDSGVCLAERLSWRDSGDGMFYPIVAYKIVQQAPANFATSPELQYLAPEDYEMPPADPSLLAMANKQLCDDLEAARGEVADLRERLHQQIEQWQTDTGRLAADLRAATEARSQAINEADRLRTELAAERQAREALQKQGNAIDVTAAAVGYLVRVPKRPPMIRRKLEAARLAALGAVRAGAARADVLAIVPVGAARRGADWGEA